MKIVIAASHRFHLLDLAIQLERLGHEVVFFSYVPTKRTDHFGLSKKASFSLFWPLAPLLIVNKVFGHSQWPKAILHWSMDFLVGRLMPRCDVFICLGTVYLQSISIARRRLNATTIVEWGSKHILEQEEILSNRPSNTPQWSYFVKRSLAGYQAADYIAIPSDHVRLSFLKHNILESKLLTNPYGVDLSKFQLTKKRTDYEFDLIIVGGWSYRKGCDLLQQVCEDNDLKLLHVGPIVDIPFPESSRFTHIDSVDQNDLPNYYEQAKIFVLPSREEGLAMVQCQALACGLPIVCSQDSGGRDLRQFLDDGKWIVEMTSFSVESLYSAIQTALKLFNEQSNVRSVNLRDNESMSWRSYGERYQKNLLRRNEFQLDV